MITSTVGPLLLPLRASRSLDTLCFLPSAKDNAAAKSATSPKSASRAPQVVVIFRTLSCDGRLVSGVVDISRAPKLHCGGKSLKCREKNAARCLVVVTAVSFRSDGVAVDSTGRSEV